MHRQLNAILLVFVAFLVAASCSSKLDETSDFSIVETSIPELRKALEDGEITSRELVVKYLTRIALYEDRLNALITVNPNALKEADFLDLERAAGRILGDLHGIPVALKDNIQTTHIPTTAGALAFEGFIPPYEATLTKNLRDAGAIIIAKAGLTEFANWMGGEPTPMPGNYNSLSGFAFNPYDSRRDPREGRFDGRPVLSTGGSSSGIGTAVSFWAGNVGTDTGGSVISPSNANMLVGIRPTLGRISRWGIAPVTLDHDTAGPMTRTVVDAAILLGVMEGSSPDPNDPATSVCAPPSGGDYTQFLNPDGLSGARIGIPRSFYYDPIELEGEDSPRGGLTEEQALLMDEAIAILKSSGATVVDPANVPSYTARNPNDNFATWNYCAGLSQRRGFDSDCTVNFKYGMKRDFDIWLESLGPSAPVKSLTELRNWNLDHLGAGTLKFGQSRFDISDEMDLEADRPRYEADRSKDEILSRMKGIDAVLGEHRLDAILTPSSRGAAIAARARYPIIVVPFGFAHNPSKLPFPEGFEAKPSPFGVGFTGTACSEPRLIELAYAFEQASKGRVAPPDFP